VYGFVSIVWRSHCSKFVAGRRVTYGLPNGGAFHFFHAPCDPCRIFQAIFIHDGVLPFSEGSAVRVGSSHVYGSLPKLACLTKWRPHAKRRHIQPDTALGARSLCPGSCRQDAVGASDGSLGSNLIKDETTKFTKAMVNVWPAPSASGFCSWHEQSAQTYPALRLCRWPRWRSARSAPHKGAGMRCHLPP
jgi:hypothetical protein